MSRQTKLKLINTSEVLKNIPDNVKAIFADRLNLNEDIDAQIEAFEADINYITGNPIDVNSDKISISDEDVEFVMRNL